MGKCVHSRQKSRCKDCGGSRFCVHGREKRKCKDCGGSSLCVHNRQKSRCKDCGGASFCVHGREKRKCKDCGGSGFCVHNRHKYRCKDCGGSGRRHQNDVNSSGHGLPKGPKKRRLGAGDVARDALGRIHVEDGLMRMVCHAHVNSSGQGVPMGPKKMRVGAGAGSKRPAKVNPSGQGLPKLPQGPQTEDGGRPSDSTKGDAATAGIFFDRAQSFKEAVHLAMVNMCATNIVSGPIVKTEPSQDEDGGVSLDHNAGCVMQFANNERFLTDLNGRPIGRAWGLSKAGLASTKVSMINAARKEGGIPLLSGDETLNVLNQYGRAEGYDPKALHSLARAQRPDDLDYEGRCAQTRLFNYLDATRDILPTKIPAMVAVKREGPVSAEVKYERRISPEANRQRHRSPDMIAGRVAVKRE